MTTSNQLAILASWTAEQSNRKTKTSDESLTVLEVENIRLYHEAIIKRADENHLRTFKKSFEFIGGPFYKVKAL